MTDPYETPKEMAILLGVPPIDTEDERDKIEERNQLRDMEKIPTRQTDEWAVCSGQGYRRQQIGQESIDRKLVDEQSHWRDGRAVTE